MGHTIKKGPPPSLNIAKKIAISGKNPINITRKNKDGTVNTRKPKINHFIIRYSLFIDSHSQESLGYTAHFLQVDSILSLLE